LLRKLNELGIAFRDLHTEQSSLEDIFVSLIDRGSTASNSSAVRT
jgi:ABC-2 type transport system ATP-binding protein